MKTKNDPYGLKCKINPKKFSIKGFPPFGKNSQKIPFFFGTPPLDWLGKCVESGGPGDFRNFEVILMVLVYLVNLVVLMNLLILVILPGYSAEYMGGYL